SLQLSEAFGYSGKLVFKDMGKMAKDVGRFGNLSVRRLGEVAIRARSLGLEVESLGKVVDKFLTFDDAAESAARLAQAFGINVDSMALMREASNGGMGAIDELRRAFFEAGHDAEKMSLVQLRLLAQNTGLSEEEARLAFSMKNRGRSMEDISKQSGVAEKKELSQAEAMSKLADATERYIRFIDMSGGLFDRFAQGFQRGIKHSHKFLETMFSLRAVSEAVWYAGFELGQVFVDAFPGVTKMLDALQMLYNPAKYEGIMKKVNGAFTNFFEELSDPKKALKATRQLFDNLKKAFLDSWSGEGTAEAEEGAADFLSGIGNAIAGFIPVMADVFVRGLEILGDMIGGDTSVLDSTASLGGDLGSGITNAIKSLVDPIANTLKRLWKSKKIQKAAIKFLESVLDSIGDEGSGIIDVIIGLVDPIANTLERLGKSKKIQNAAIKLLDRMADVMNKWADGAEAKNSGFGDAMGNFFFAAINLAWELGAKPALKWLAGKLFDALKAVVKGFSAIARSIAAPFAKAWEGIKLMFSFDVALKLMKNFVKGMEEGMGPIEDNPLISSMFGAIDLVMGPKGFKIDSPSKFAEKEIGENLGLGLTRGVESSLSGFSGTMLDKMNLPATNDAIALMKSNMETDIKAINKSLESIPDIDLAAKLSPTSSGLGINGDVLKIESGPLNLNLHLTVTMEADQVARQLVDKASMVRKERIG
ncbi:hypothetical protein HN588_01820, partial [Candidatus Bathyarchaeota archaeon]|nr:hypothetical protein [Candidatus Bathyarchaeota archaeon]